MILSARLTRPRTRAECPEPDASGVRRCPWISCRYHLLLDVASDGRLSYNPGRGARSRWLPLSKQSREDDAVAALDDLAAHCALDVVDEGERTPAEIATFLGVSEQMIAYNLGGAYRKLRRALR